MINIKAARIVYYLAVIAFHYAVFFTDFGVYWHGGHLVDGIPFVLYESIVLEAVAVLISAAAIKLVLKVPAREKILVVLCGILPVIFVCGRLSFLLKFESLIIYYMPNYHAG